MTNIPYDQFSKQYLEELLSPFGEVNISQEIPGEARQVDVFFVPDRQNCDHQILGILGQMTAKPCLLEPFRHQPTPTDIRNCLLKLFLTLADRQRQAKRDQTKIPEAQLPTLWILTSTASPKLLTNFKAEPLSDWPEGVYFLGESLKTAIIALNQLPITPDTLWLRILGKGKTQQQAIDELLTFAPDHPQRQRTLELLLTWGITIENTADFTQSEQEIMIKLRALYQENIQAAVWNCASVKPLDLEALSHLSSSPVFSIEEHSVLGGFGSAVAEFLSARKNPPRLIRLGIPDEFLHDCGEQEEARVYCGLDAASLARRIAAEVA
jgi:hypothetical protein